MNTEPTAAPGGARATRPWGRPLGVLFSPQDTFRSIAARPSWLPPLLVLMVLYVGLQVLVSQRIDMEAVLHEAMARQDQPIDEAQIAKMAEMQSQVGVACQVVLFPLGLVVVAALFLGLANLAGGEIGFVRSLAVTAHGLMPNAIAWLLTVPVALGREQIDLSEAQNGLLASHLAFFAPEDAPVWLVALLGRVDLFSLWSLLLLAIGLRVVAGLSKGASAAIVLLLWLLWIGLTVGMTTLGFTGAG